MTTLPASFLDWAFAQRLTGKEFMTLLAIKRHEDLGHRFPPIGRLSKYAGVGRTHMHPALNTLLARGLIRQIPTERGCSRFEVVC
jgi:DNA-binding MarR family transcriptional regulator